MNDKHLSFTWDMVKVQIPVLAVMGVFAFIFNAPYFFIGGVVTVMAILICCAIVDLFV